MVSPLNLEDPTLIPALLSQGPRSLGDLNAALLFYDGQYLLQYRDEQGGEHHKLLTPDAVRSALSAHTQDSGWLPPGVIRTGSTAAGPFSCYWQPPARHTIALILDTTPAVQRLTLPLPGLLLAGLGTRYWVWASPVAVFTPQAPLYHAPFPNVYRDGRICWGTNRMPAATPAAMPAVWQLFLDAPFNGHLAGGLLNSPGDVRALLRDLAAGDQPAFPTAHLMPHEFGTAGVAVERVRQL